MNESLYFHCCHLSIFTEIVCQHFVVLDIFCFHHLESSSIYISVHYVNIVMFHSLIFTSTWSYAQFGLFQSQTGYRGAERDINTSILPHLGDLKCCSMEGSKGHFNWMGTVNTVTTTFTYYEAPCWGLDHSCSSENSWPLMLYCNKLHLSQKSDHRMLLLFV